MDKSKNRGSDRKIWHTMKLVKDLYINGNYQVTIFGIYGETREYLALRDGEELVSNFPDSIDLKITNKCSHGCKFCHESSSSTGKSFNLSRTLEILDDLPKVGLEIAIGGGNIFDCWEDFLSLCTVLKKRNHNIRCTINLKDLFDPVKLSKLKNDLIENFSSLCLGISVPGLQSFLDYKKFIEDNPDLPNPLETFPRTRVVYHIIAGLFPAKDLSVFLEEIDYCAVLILGYKNFGRALNLPTPDMTEWKDVISKLLFSYRGGTCVDKKSKLFIGFDNLAITQLDLKNCLLKKEWDYFYLGNDFSHSMYIDAVEETYAPNSRCPIDQRVSWDSERLLDYFNKNKSSWN